MQELDFGILSVLDSVRTASCILHAVLADRCRRKYGSGWTGCAGRSEYLLCPIGGFGEYRTLQCRCYQIFSGEFIL